MCKYQISKAFQRLFVGFLFFSFIFTPSAYAIEYGGLGGRPAYPRSDNPRTESIFVHTLEAGAVQEEGVKVVNNTAEKKTVMIYAADSTPSTDGAFACKQLSETKTDVGAWIKLEKSEIVLESGTNETIPFTISVPQSASVGEHNGCILIQEKKEKVEGQTGAILSIRTGLRVVVTVPGEITRKLELVGFSLTPKQDSFLLNPLLKNTGNVSIDADVSVITRYFFGLVLKKHGGQYPVLRGETSNWNFELARPFWGGWYRSTFAVEYDQNQEASVGVKSGKELTRLEGNSIWFFSAPAPLALVIEIFVLAVLVACCWLWMRSRKRMKQIQQQWVEYEIEQGDDIQSIAKECGVSWKLLVKVNKLKPPYALRAGETIKVPPLNE